MSNHRLKSRPRSSSSMAPLAVASGLLALGALGWGFLHGSRGEARPAAAPRAKAPTEVLAAVLLVDASRSFAGDDVKARCADMAGEVRRLASRHRGPLDVTLIATGDRAHTGGTVQSLLGWTRLERHFRPFVDAAVIEREFLASVDAAAESCQQRIAAADDSRIFAAMSWSVASLDAHCAGLQAEGARCVDSQVYAVTDGQETGHEAIARALRARAAGHAPSAPLPVIRSAVGASLRMCGTALSRDAGSVLARRVKDPRAVEAVWQEVLPGALIDPLCPEPIPTVRN